MSLAPMKDMMVEARKKGYAIGAFEFWSLDSAYAIVRAAEELNTPVILQSGCYEGAFAGGYDKLAVLGKIAAESVKVPVALHLDHGATLDEVKLCLDAGYTSVMLDASSKPLEENIRLTQQVVAMAHPLGVTVEAELGVLDGAEAGVTIDEAMGLQTDPDEAAYFVEQTGVDVLAVSIGTSHGHYKFPPKINIPRLMKIADKVALPLVLHGGSGTPEDKMKEAIQHGIAKINICTDFIAAYGKGFTAAQQTEGFRYNVPNLFVTAQSNGQALVKHMLELFLNLR